MLTYIYAGKLFCGKCGRAIREKLKAKGKVPPAGYGPFEPDNPWSYDSKDYPKGPYHSNELTHGPEFFCAECKQSLGPLAIYQLEGEIIDPWTDSLPSPDASKAGYKEYIPNTARISLDGLTDRRRRMKGIEGEPEKGYK